MIFVGLVILIDWLTKRTVYGRHIYAVGGNAESARRAGIQVDRVRISVFMLASTDCGDCRCAGGLALVGGESIIGRQ